MADKTSSLKRLQISNFKLNSLLEITNAINEDLSVDDLLKRYKKILTEELEIGKVIIFKLNGSVWDCIINAGFPETLSKSFNPTVQLPSLTEITFISADPNRFSESNPSQSTAP